MPDRESKTAWTTECEIEFLDKLVAMRSQEKRTALLEGYLTGFCQRTSFGRLDPVEVLAYAEEQLRMARQPNLFRGDG
jgi:hypothetical protein